MTYTRVIPRDLFNESMLLKCLGRILILLETSGQTTAKFLEDSVDSFEIVQDESSGHIRVNNLNFTINDVPYNLEHPLNSQEPWPMWLESKKGDDDFEPIKVFEPDGTFTDEFSTLIQGTKK